MKKLYLVGILLLAHAAFGQAFVLGPAQSALSGCSWPTWATVSNGVAICPVDINGVVQLALGMNQGPFVLAANGNPPVIRVGSVITVNETCPKGTGNIPGGWTTLTCKLTITAIQY